VKASANECAEGARNAQKHYSRETLPKSGRKPTYLLGWASGSVVLGVALLQHA